MRISVITAVYNRAATVREAIASVQAQRDAEVEHVLIDGASTDGSLAIMEEMRDGRTVLVSEPDEGIYDALSKGFERATGDALGLMHSDDLFADDEVLSSVTEAFRRVRSDGAAVQAAALLGDDEVPAAGPREALDAVRLVRVWFRFMAKKASLPCPPCRTLEGTCAPVPNTIKSASAARRTNVCSLLFCSHASTESASLPELDQSSRSLRTNTICAPWRVCGARVRRVRVWTAALIVAHCLDLSFTKKYFFYCLYRNNNCI